MRRRRAIAATQKVYDSNSKVAVQGGSTKGGGGSVRYYTLLFPTMLILPNWYCSHVILENVT